MGPIYKMRQLPKRRQLEVRKWYIRKLGPQGHPLANCEDLGFSFAGTTIPLFPGMWKGWKLELWLTSTRSRDPDNPRSL